MAVSRQISFHSVSQLKNFIVPGDSGILELNIICGRDIVAKD